jgi:hypothetical protein
MKILSHKKVKATSTITAQGMVARLRDEIPENLSSSTGGTRYFSLRHCNQTSSGADMASVLMGNVSFQGIKLLRKAVITHFYLAEEIKNYWIHKRAAIHVAADVGFNYRSKGHH